MLPPADGFAARLVRGPALRTQPDRRLVTLVREGYEAAFEEIVRRYGKPLTRYAASIVGSRGEDVTQDAFSKALLALRRDSDAEIELRPWLFRIVRNTALNDLRDSPPTPELLAEAIVGKGSPAEEAERREELADLMHRLQSLPDRQRAAIVMRELEGLSHEEIAAALGLSGGAARQAIFRARQALRDGFGLLLPLPLLRLLIDHGNEMVAAGAGSAGSAAASSALGGAGAGVALKAATATVLVAGAIGAGVAVQHERHGDRAQAAPEPATQSVAGTDGTGKGPTGLGTPAESGPASTQADDRSNSDDHRKSESGDDHHGTGDSSGGDDDNRSDSGPGREGFVRQSVDDDGGGSGQDGGDRHGGRSGGDDHSGGSGPGPSGGGGQQGSGSSGQSGHGSSRSDDGSASIESSSGPGPGGDTGSSSGSGPGSQSGSGGDDSSGGSDDGSGHEEPGHSGSDSGSGTSGAGEQLP